MLPHTFRTWIHCILPALVLGAVSSTFAQDTRTVTEPTFPTTCAVLAAPLSVTSPFITGAGLTVTQIDAVSASETSAITSAVAACPSGQAVELSLGTSASSNAFLINPITIPYGVSLIVDGGVTVFGTLDVANYQVTSTSSSVCGVPSGHAGGCLNLLNFSGAGGLYGYGVIDARGNGTLMCSVTSGSQNCSYAVGKNFWYLTGIYASTTASPCAPNACYTQNTPILLVDIGDNFTIYQITLRNTPNWNMNVVGNSITIWGLKEQATWAVPNTDGMDITGTNITVANSTIANGDDAIAIGAYAEPSSNITIENITGYSRNGVSTSTALEYGISNVLFQNMNLTSDVASLNGTTVNGVTQAQMATVNGASTGITSYIDALPATSGFTRGLNIKSDPNRQAQGANGNSVSNFHYQNICLQDVNNPITTPNGGADAGDFSFPRISNILYDNIHVLAPTSQYQKSFEANGNARNTGLYTPTFSAFNLYGSTYTEPPADYHFNNVVFDDLTTGGSSLGTVYAWNAQFTNTGNVYPAALNHFISTAGSADTGYRAGNTYLDLNGDQMLSTSSTSTPTSALNCPASNWPFLVGNMYLSLGGASATGTSTNLQKVILASNGSVTLNAMVEPATGQAEYFVPGDYGISPGLLDTGAPALTQPVEFYEGSTLVGTASLSANGTLASLTLTNLTNGSHTYTAVYPADSYYASYSFGSVIVQVPNTTPKTTLSTPMMISYGMDSALNVTVAGSGQMPTGTVSIYDGSTGIATQPLTSGAASISVLLAAGMHSLTAAYSGDGYNFASTSTPVVVTVSKGTTTLSLTPSVPATNQYQVITFTATLPGIAFAAPPSGTVSFTDGAATLGTATLMNGVATLSVPMVNIGTRTIVATYGGDINYLGTTNSTTVTVAQALATGGCFAGQ